MPNAPSSTGHPGLLGDDDPAPIETLYARYAGVVFSLALRIVGDPRLAEEVLEEVFFRAWAWSQGPNPVRGTVFSWLVEITRAVALEAVSDRRPASPFDGSPETGVEATMDAWSRETAQAISAALAELSPEQRQAIELTYFDGVAEEEIATLLGVPVERVRALLREAVTAIAGALALVARS